MKEAKEIAEELIDEMYTVDCNEDDFDGVVMYYKLAVECAKVAVKEILKVAYYADYELYNLYLDVQKELDNYLKKEDE